VAVNYRIPLVVWGENSAVEYGHKSGADTGCELTVEWMRTYGVTHGTTARDWVGTQLSAKDLTAYRGPTEMALAQSGVKAIFLGHFFDWDPQTSLAEATAHGFREAEEGPKTGYYDYADIDDDFISVHHFLKWYKFGFTRTFDNLSLEIRNDRLTRDQAIDIIAERGNETPHEDIDRLCRFLEIGSGAFFNIIEKFRNLDIWKRVKGNWVIENFLIPNWNWNENY
jgi:hypothetical protein